MSNRRRVKALGWPVLALTLLPALAHPEEAATYENPPERVVWIEGESCEDHNWTGPMTNCWVFEYTPVHGGVLDVASWRLPDAGAYHARFPFKLAEPGEYIVYFLGRLPGYLASPITWQIDAGPEHREPADKPNSSDQGNTLDKVMFWKYAVTRLGRFNAGAGAHTITIRVREPASDRGLEYYSQQIDAILIARASSPVAGAPAPAVKAVEEKPAPSPDSAADSPGTKRRPIRAGALRAALGAPGSGFRTVALGNGGPSLVSAAAAPRLVEVEFVSGRPAATPMKAATEREGANVVTSIHGEGFEATVCFTPDSEHAEIRATARVVNTGREPICSVRFAPFDGVALGGDASDDHWLVGDREVEARSIDFLGSRSLRSPQFKFDWVCVWDESAALHARIEDPGLLDTAVHYGSQHGGHVVFEKHPRIEPGQTWDAPPLVIGAYAGGDWHPAADRFSQWWHTWAARPHIPEWVDSVGGLTLGYTFFAQNDEGAMSLDTVKTKNAEWLTRCQDTSGITFGHTGAWLVHETEAWFPMQYGLDMPHLQHFRAATNDIRAHGGRVSVYTNPLMFSRVIPEYERYGQRLAAVGRDGTIRLTEHTHRHHPTALPFPSLEWAEKFCDTVEEMVLQGRPDCLYMDQLGAIPGHLDFTPEAHGHTHYGEWTAATAQFVERVHARLRPGHPELATMIECPCPAAQQHVTLGLLGGNRVLQYVFPYYRNCHGGYDKTEPEKAMAQAREAFRVGMVLLYNLETLKGLAESECGIVRDIIRLKQAVDPVLHKAAFRDTAGLTVPGGIEAGIFTAGGNSGLLLTTLNPEGHEDAVVEIDLSALGVEAGETCQAMVSGAPGEWGEVKATRKGARVRVPVPAAYAAVVKIG